MARKKDWDRALEDAIKSISIQRSLIGYISKGIALCGQGRVRDSRVAFDVASMFTNQDSENIHLLLLIKAITLFNADQRDEAMLLIKELAAACLNSDLLTCRVVEAYLRVQLGTEALDGAHHDEAADHFAAAVNSSTFPSKIIHDLYGDLIMLFGWDLESLWRLSYSPASHSDFREQCSALAPRDDPILGAEIPGQDQDGYDVEPGFFRSMHGHSQISRPRPQQRPGRFKKLRLTVTRRPLLPIAPAPTSAPPTTLSPAAALTTFKAHIRHLFTWRPDHAAPPVVDVPFAWGQKDPNTQQPNTQQPNTQQPNTQQPNTPQRQQPVAAQIDTGGHGGGKSCFCC
ncbi:hypothetical protein DEU56DRAFT_214588 [Suillus clintonianus]|uniref:uncharacterized protein n=1 Tax=Suillus clintonianus TaxID=1904413 RepID=UPI001B87F1F8|nr:uncharacterized protein DEU56DRAFT_214588 [Suillus clintonianus]KAG2111431.1 hypothetical protein DEU56DRAFT_214588 [Suillus clintonianus]